MCAEKTRNTCILIVDGDTATRELIEDTLSRRGYGVRSCGGEDMAVEITAEFGPDLILHGFHLDTAGKEFFDRIRAIRPDLGIIAMTDHGTMEAAVAALNYGAVDYLPKPVDPELLKVTVEAVLEDLRIEKEYMLSRRDVKTAISEKRLLGNSPLMLKVYKQVAQVAKHNANVLIQGETGTGKELIARAIHLNSPRMKMPFVPVNCASIPDNLLESELFGHVRGAFTGAVATRKGLFEQAACGTIFLDEIGEISHNMQVKLLRVVQEKKIRRLGDEKEISVDVRIIAATNKILLDEMSGGAFREDLFYRLGSVTIDLPPLRERLGDVELLAYHFLDRFAEEDESPVVDISESTMILLKKHSWPGNVRELEGVIERAVIICKGTQIAITDLPARLIPEDIPIEPPPGENIAAEMSFKTDAGYMSLSEAEKTYLLYILKEAGGNKSKAAKIMGVGRRTLYRMMNAHGLSEL